jgi:hypothetical protein
MVGRASPKLGPPAQVELVWIGAAISSPISAPIRDLLLRPLDPGSGARDSKLAGVTFDQYRAANTKPIHSSRLNPRGTEPRPLPSHRGDWPIFGARSGEPPPRLGVRTTRGQLHAWSGPAPPA